MDWLIRLKHRLPKTYKIFMNKDTSNTLGFQKDVLQEPNDESCRNDISSGEQLQQEVGNNLNSSDEQLSVHMTHHTSRKSTRVRKLPKSLDSFEMGFNKTLNQVKIDNSKISNTDLFNNNMNGEENSCNDDNEATFSCPHCSMVYSYPIFLRKHLWRSHQYTKDKAYQTVAAMCDVSTDKTFLTSSQSLTSDNKQDGDDRYRCEIVGQKFKLSSDLHRHQTVHTAESKFRCETCGKEFIKKASLVRHSVTHSAVKPHKCLTCGKCFHRKSNLDTHELIHSDTKPYSCEICGKKFKLSLTLHRHQTVHTGERNFRCETCDKRFSTKSSLVRHSLIHSGVKPHKCQTCGKCFSTKSDLAKHQLIHSGVKPHSCDVCGQGFTQKGHLLEHQRTHSKYKTFKCQVCGSTFTHYTSLKYHISRYHSGEKETT